MSFSCSVRPWEGQGLRNAGAGVSLRGRQTAGASKSVGRGMQGNVGLKWAWWVPSQHPATMWPLLATTKPV